MAVGDLSQIGSGSDEVVERFRPSRSGLALFSGLNLAFLGSGAAVFLVISSVQGNTTGIVLCLLVTVFLLPEAWVILRSALLAATLRASTLDTPRLFYGQRSFALDDIAGVGLLYEPSSRTSGWRLFVWLRDGEPIDIAVAGPKHSAPRDGGARREKPVIGHSLVLDWDYLAACPAGHAATAINARVTSRQGPDGLLATRARQATASTYGGVRRAYWSPDGRIGRLTRP